MKSSNLIWSQIDINIQLDYEINMIENEIDTLCL